MKEEGNQSRVRGIWNRRIKITDVGRELQEETEEREKLELKGLRGEIEEGK